MANDTQVNIAPLTISISDISISASGPAPSDIIKQGEPFSLKTTVTFGGPGAAALLPLNLPIKVTYYAESFGPGNEVSLGTANAVTNGSDTAYDLVLAVPAAVASVLTAEEVYKIAAVLRVGSSSFPALANGFSEGLTLSVYNP